MNPDQPEPVNRVLAQVPANKTASPIIDRLRASISPWTRSKLAGQPALRSFKQDNSTVIDLHSLSQQVWSRARSTRVWKPSLGSQSPALVRQFTQELFRRLQEIKPLAIRRAATSSKAQARHAADDLVLASGQMQPAREASFRSEMINAGQPLPPKSSSGGQIIPPMPKVPEDAAVLRPIKEPSFRKPSPKDRLFSKIVEATPGQALGPISEPEGGIDIAESSAQPAPEIPLRKEASKPAPAPEIPHTPAAAPPIAKAPASVIQRMAAPKKPAPKSKQPDLPAHPPGKEAVSPAAKAGAAQHDSSQKTAVTTKPGPPEAPKKRLAAARPMPAAAPAGKKPARAALAPLPPKPIPVIAPPSRTEARPSERTEEPRAGRLAERPDMPPPAAEKIIELPGEKEDDGLLPPDVQPVSAKPVQSVTRPPAAAQVPAVEPVQAEQPAAGAEHFEELPMSTGHEALLNENRAEEVQPLEAGSSKVDHVSGPAGLPPAIINPLLIEPEAEELKLSNRPPAGKAHPVEEFRAGAPELDLKGMSTAEELAQPRAIPGEKPALPGEAVEDQPADKTVEPTPVKPARAVLLPLPGETPLTNKIGSLAAGAMPGKLAGSRAPAQKLPAQPRPAGAGRSSLLQPPVKPLSQPESVQKRLQQEASLPEVITPRPSGSPALIQRTEDAQPAGPDASESAAHSQDITVKHLLLESAPGAASQAAEVKQLESWPLKNSLKQKMVQRSLPQMNPPTVHLVGRPAGRSLLQYQPQPIRRISQAAPRQQNGEPGAARPSQASQPAAQINPDLLSTEELVRVLTSLPQPAAPKGNFGSAPRNEQSQPPASLPGERLPLSRHAQPASPGPNNLPSKTTQTTTSSAPLQNAARQAIQRVAQASNGSEIPPDELPLAPLNRLPVEEKVQKESVEGKPAPQVTPIKRTNPAARAMVQRNMDQEPEPSSGKTINYEELARKILPIIKRLLTIERERGQNW